MAEAFGDRKVIFESDSRILVRNIKGNSNCGAEAAKFEGNKRVTTTKNLLDKRSQESSLKKSSYNN
ncbi:hypothetical protein ACE6H2_027423 [Prunus campanulata]